MLDGYDLDRLEALAGGDFEIGSAIFFSDDDAPQAVQAPPVDIAAPAQGLDLADLDRLGEIARRRQAPLAPEPHARRSSEAMAHARKSKASKRKEAGDAKEAAEKETIETQLQRVQTLVPSIATSLGLQQRKKRSRIETKVKLSEDQATFLIRCSFQQSIPRGIGVRHSRLQAMACTLVFDLQSAGLAKMLWQCAMFRLRPDAGFVNVVVIGLTFESDSTTQKMAQHLIQAVGRPTKQRLDTEVVNSRGTIRVCLMQVRRSTGDVEDEVLFSHQWHARSCVIMGKTAPFILASLELGMPFELKSPERRLQWYDALTEAADACLLDLHADKGSNNLPAMRHLGAVWDERPGNMSDASCCEIHSLQHVKNGMKEVKNMLAVCIA